MFPKRTVSPGHKALQLEVLALGLAEQLAESGECVLPPARVPGGGVPPAQAHVRADFGPALQLDVQQEVDQLLGGEEGGHVRLILHYYSNRLLKLTAMGTSESAGLQFSAGPNNTDHFTKQLNYI